MWHHAAGDVERCDECRFDSTAYTDQDVAGTLRNLANWASQSLDGIDHTDTAKRPTPTTWSPAEYLRHVKRVVWSMAGLVELAAEAPGTAVDGTPPADASPTDPVADIDTVHEIVRIHEESTRLLEAWRSFDTDAPPPLVVVNGRPADPAGIVRHAVHDATHHLSDIGRGVAALGRGTPIGSSGVVALVHRSGGGVPKMPVDEAEVGYRGIGGDRQAHRVHHGRVWQALCLWSTEVIDRVAAEGHPVAPGSAGENLTLSGLDWSNLRPGTRLVFADGGPLIETTMWTEPCRTIAASFVDRNFRRIDTVRYPGDSRIYAKVLRDGTVRPGMRVTVVA